MTQKERLVELLENAPGHSNTRYKSYKEAMEDLADYLLNNGVIVPPCKIGTILYNVSDKIEEICVFGFTIDKDDSYLMVEHWYESLNKMLCQNEYWLINFNEIGKSCFITREEAEQALKERETNV